MQVNATTTLFAVTTALLLLQACGRTPGTAAAVSHESPPALRQASSNNAVSDGSTSEESADSGVVLPFEPDLGCEQDIDRAKDAGEQLDAMHVQCAPGTHALLKEARKLRVGSTSNAEVALPLTSGSCVRIGVATQPSGEAIEARMTGPGMRDSWERKARAPMLLGKDGPTCVREAGSYTLQLRALGRGAETWVQAWVTEAPQASVSR